MIAILERVVRLWTRPVDTWDDPEAALGEVPASPLMANGIEMTLAELAGRVRPLTWASCASSTRSRSPDC